MGPRVLVCVCVWCMQGRVPAKKTREQAVQACGQDEWATVLLSIGLEFIGHRAVVDTVVNLSCCRRGKGEHGLLCMYIY